MREKILEFRKLNPGVGYRKIGETLGLHPSTVRYYLDPKFKQNADINANKRRKARKVVLVQSVGGKCCLCGYDKCMEALDFHHLNPQEKSFDSDRTIRDLALSKIWDEIRKCILVCNRCHKEIHHGFHADKNLEQFRCRVTEPANGFACKAII